MSRKSSRLAAGLISTALLLIVALALANSAVAQTLRFKSGFDANSTVVDDNEGNPPNPNSLSDGIKIEGFDNTSGFNWGYANSDIPGNGNFRFNLDTTGNGAWATIIDDPTNSNRGKVFWFWLEYPTSIKGRVQARVAGYEYDEVTNIRKVYLHQDFAELKDLSGTLGYLIIEEMWTNPNFSDSNPDFRINLQIEKQSGVGQPLNWELKGGYTNGGGTEWRADTIGEQIWVDDILGQWVTLVTYYKKPTSPGTSTGKMKVKLIKENGTEQVLFNLDNVLTHHGTDTSQQTGMTQNQIAKVYTPKSIVDHMRNNAASGGFIAYWDDWEYWEGDRYSSYMPAPPLLTATAVSSSEIELSWGDINNETGFTIQWATDEDFTTGVDSDTVSANSTSYSATGLSASTPYYFRVQGTNAGGDSDWSVVASDTTEAGGAPVTHEAESLSESHGSGDSITLITPSGVSGQAVRLNGDAVGDWVEFTVNIAGSDTYNVTVQMARNAWRAISKLLVDSTQLGSAYDAYNPTGDVVEVDFGNRSLSAGNHTFRFEVTGRNASSQASDYQVAIDYIKLTPVGDTTAPTVAITAPSAGGVVGNTTVSADASDNVGVVGVQFKLDGVNLGAEDTTAPYSIVWDTTAASDGSHSLAAVARDAADNTTTSAAVPVTVNNTPVTSEAESLSEAHSSGDSVTLIGPTGVSGQAVRLNGDAVGDWVEFTINVATAGTYNVKVQVSRNAWRAISKLLIDSTQLGSAYDAYNPTGGVIEVDFGNRSLSAGNHAFRFEVTGRNASSQATDYQLAIDYITLTPVGP